MIKSIINLLLALIYIFGAVLGAVMVAESATNDETWKIIGYAFITASCIFCTVMCFQNEFSREVDQ